MTFSMTSHFCAHTSDRQYATVVVSALPRLTLIIYHLFMTYLISILHIIIYSQHPIMNSTYFSGNLQHIRHTRWLLKHRVAKEEYTDHHQLNTYILYVVEAQGWTFASVLQRLR